MERCCQHLVTLGKMQGGYITYDVISDILSDAQCDLSLELIDLVYERLTAEGIECVDRLPESEVLERRQQHFYEEKRSKNLPEPQPRAISRRRRKRHAWHLEDMEPEAEVDVLAFVRYRGLSSIETYQSSEHWDSNEVDLLRVDLPKVFGNVFEKDSEACSDPSQDIFADPIVKILLHDIARIEKMTAAEEKELSRLAEEGDQDAAARLIEANLIHVFRQATNYIGQGLEFLDLFQEGCIGLIKAVERFDWREGKRLMSYSAFWALQAMSRAIADYGRTIRLPVHVVDAIKQLRSVTSHLYKVYGREPTTAEIAGEMGLSEEKVCELQILSQPVVSLEAVLAEWKEEETYPGWFLAADNVLLDDDIDEYVDQSIMREVIPKILERLQPREKEVLQLRFGLDGDRPQTLEQIAQRFGLTRERIRQIEANAIKKLKRLTYRIIFQIVQSIFD
ncbi:sigma-70 family RNA polymerase sigma factor [Acetomicrobium sp. S15 = DSM 107314]|uniref:sigma-70 family RNA polymerase sigma factor n=1 Tax=Acetomicrobium sp. S15 = DSM 107314 TaxID=2529858 RepID=UPI0018E1937F|nr:sigma-70 family RNA polymerase sigma factor [Acetomicrobium sp. S15 = DSM 107314]